MSIEIFGYDIGGHTKIKKFYGDSNGQLWYAPEFPVETPRVETPHDVPAPQFMAALRETLAGAGYWVPGALRGFSICGPVVNGTCLRLINRGIHESFAIEAEAVGNDGFMAMLGSRIAGTAKNHQGALAYLTLGTGIGFGALHWDEWSPDRLATNDGETHFTVRGSTRICNCGREGCFEASANEDALWNYAVSEGLALPDGTDVGREFERIMVAEPMTERGQKVARAILTWHNFLAQGLANAYALLNMGGNTLRPPALFVLGGGLSELINEDLLEYSICEEFGGDPFLGKQFAVKRELALGNRAGCVGAAAAALARRLHKHVTEITFLNEPPK